MSDKAVPDIIIDRLRDSLRAAGVPYSGADLQGVIDGGFLLPAVALEQIAEHIPPELAPDYLHEWAPQAPNGVVRTLPGGEAVQQVPAMVPSSATRARIPGPNPNGDYRSISELAGALRAREVSPVELTEAALGRTAERDPVLNAFQLVLHAEARAAARLAEQQILGGGYHGPLHGVPVAVKDLLAMRGTVTTAGSRILTGRVTDFDAAAVERLRSAGAVITGKTRLSEWAYSPGSNNAHYGPTRNPWNHDHDAGGSSSGSAAAVADGLVPAALGSDTGGSIRIPAALCGTVGLKPTFGRVSLHGVIPLSTSLDHLGPITRTVEDAAILLELLAGRDVRDPRTRNGGECTLPTDLDVGVTGLRIGVLRDDGSGRTLATPEAVAAWEAGLAALERNGAELLELAVPELHDLRAINGAILACEAVTYHQHTLRTRLHDYGGFARYRLLAAFVYSARDFVIAQRARGAVRARLARLWDRVDLVSTPTMPYGAPALGVAGVTVFTSPFNALGWPAITVPVGLTSEGLPLGLQLASRPWDEATALRAARVVEADGPWVGART